MHIFQIIAYVIILKQLFTDILLDIHLAFFRRIIVK